MSGSSIDLSAAPRASILSSISANIGLAIRKIRGIAGGDGLTAQIAARLADQARAAALNASAQSDLTRPAPISHGVPISLTLSLSASSSVSGDELTVARNALATAQANVTAAREAQTLDTANRSSAVGTRNANSEMISTGPIESNPEVAAAIAARDRRKGPGLLPATLLRRRSPSR